jgi:5-amino-6-(5-phosphoribosylamino)uracil reductase/diaminohydroxyphosphoribosylaminopyrimidine deaminase/5-amino-6-(5-phosphoribosylamino)uracil reductase
MQRPRVTLHFAQSLDGRIATRSGAARWISGPLATRFAHELRAVSGAVIVGSGTALADDPLLTVRHVPGPQPLRVVLDGRARLPASAKLFVDPGAPTLHVTRHGASGGADLPRHVERWALPSGPNGGVDLAALLACLGARGISAVLVEGGSRVLTSFLRAGLCDRLIVTVAPMVIGCGVDAVGDLATDRIDQALRFTIERVLHLGEDRVLELVPRGVEGALS